MSTAQIAAEERSEAGTVSDRKRRKIKHTHESSSDILPPEELAKFPVRNVEAEGQRRINRLILALVGVIVLCLGILVFLVARR